MHQQSALERFISFKRCYVLRNGGGLA